MFLLCERGTVQPFPSPAGPILISSPQNIGKADFIVIRSTAEAVFEHTHDWAGALFLEINQFCQRTRLFVGRLQNEGVGPPERRSTITPPTGVQAVERIGGEAFDRVAVATAGNLKSNPFAQTKCLEVPERRRA